MQPAVATGFLAGVVVSGVAIWGGARAILVLAAAGGLGAIGFWLVREAQERRMDLSELQRPNRRIDRPEPERLDSRTEGNVEPVAVVAAEPDPSQQEFVAFHDFNKASGHFDHW